MFRARQNVLIRAAVILAGAAALLCLYMGVLALGLPMPACIFYHTTGWECPGCGSQRALHALLQGHIMEAWSYILLLPPALVLILLILLLPPGSRLKDRLTSPAAMYILLAVVLELWLIRKIFQMTKF